MRISPNLIIVLLLGFVTGIGSHIGWDWSQELIRWHRFQGLRHEIDAEIIKMKTSVENEPIDPEWAAACDFFRTAVANACHEPGSTSEYSLRRFHERLRDHVESSPRDSALIRELWAELQNVSPHAFRYTIQFEPMLDEILAQGRK